MRAVGIITEYDPFHAGHAWQIAQARQMGAQSVVVCMSTDLTQRGGIALLPPQVRAKAALQMGADLVLGLPNPCAVQSAEGFAAAGVAVLSALPQLDSLVFGAETPDVQGLCKVAEILQSEAFAKQVRGVNQKGVSFAAARAEAAGKLHPKAAEILASPNNNLGVEYCKAIAAQKSHLKPVPIQRIGAAHGQQTPGENGFASASMLRRLWHIQGADALAEYVPPSALQLYQQAAEQGLDLSLQAFDLTVLSRLRGMSVQQIAKTRGTAEGLEHRLFNMLRNATNLQQLYDALKTKRYTHARLRRYVLCAALGYTEDLPQTPPYLHVLGANPAGLSLLKHATMPADASLAALEKTGKAAAQMAQAHAAGTDLAALCRKTPGVMGLSYTQPPVFMK